MLPCASAVCTSDPSCGSAPGHHSSHRGTHQGQHVYVCTEERGYPHNGGKIDRGYPHNGGKIDRGYPHNGGKIDRGYPHNGGKTYVHGTRA